jgi:DNA-binding transcriptional ArsR family regulator
MTRNTDLTDPNVVKAIAHPLRVRVLGILDRRTATPRQIADEIEHPLPLVSYHVRQLAKLGLIKLVETRPVRGTIEHHYRAVARPEISNEIWGRVPGIVKEALVAAALGQLGEQATASAAAGGFSRTQAHLDRTSVILDERGLDALSAELVKLLERIDRIEEASAKRLKRDGHEGEVRMTLGLLLFDQVEVGESDGPSGQRGRRRPRTSRQARPRSARS